MGVDLWGRGGRGGPRGRRHINEHAGTRGPIEENNARVGPRGSKSFLNATQTGAWGAVDVRLVARHVRVGDDGIAFPDDFGERRPWYMSTSLGTACAAVRWEGEDILGM